MKNRLLVFMGMVVLVIGYYYRVSSFEDDFSDGSNWVGMFGSYNASSAGGEYIVENTGASISALKHDREAGGGFSDMTYSVKMRSLDSVYNYMGILFSWNSLDGYSFVVTSKQEFYIQKAEGGDFSNLLYSGRNSFINKLENTLKVSKRGDTINLFCNDVYLTTVIDNDNPYESGSVGIVLSEGQTVAYDYAEIAEDEFAEGSPNAYYKDDFSDGDINGWWVNDNLQTAPWVSWGEDSVMHIGEEAVSSYSIVVTSGDFNNGSVRAVIEHSGGSDSTDMYGIVRLAMRDDGTYSAFVCQIGRNRRAASYILNSGQSIQYNTDSYSAISIDGIDTLEMGGPDDFTFNVNGTPLLEAGEIFDFTAAADTLDFNYAGFLVDSGVSVDIQYFSAGDSTPVKHVVRDSRRAPVNRPVYMLGGTGIIFDPLGRKVGSYEDNLKKKMYGLGKGQYFIKPDKNGKVRRAIIIK